MMCHNPDLGSASDWLKQVSLTARPIRITTQIQVVTYGRFVLVPDTSFHRGTRGGIAKYWLFSQPIWLQLVNKFSTTGKSVFFYIYLLGLVCNTKKYWHIIFKC